jgi:hypothetical protein
METLIVVAMIHALYLVARTKPGAPKKSVPDDSEAALNPEPSTNKRYFYQFEY